MTLTQILQKIASVFATKTELTNGLNTKANSSHTHIKSQITDFPTLATVATSGSYNDLTNKPTIPTVNNATLTIQKNGTSAGTFTANASANKTINITVPTKTSDLSLDNVYTKTEVDNIIDNSVGASPLTDAEINEVCVL